MPQVDMAVETPVAPDAVRSALLDFSDRRPDIWPGITPSLYKVYAVEETSADVQEGTRLPIGAFWARERYDWSDPQTVRWTVQESNFCAPGSYMSATITPRDGGGSHVALHWERNGTTVLGKLMGRIVVLTKGKPVAASFEKGLKRVEVGSPAS